MLMKKINKIEKKINESKLSKKLVDIEKNIKKSVKTYLINKDIKTMNQANQTNKNIYNIPSNTSVSSLVKEDTKTPNISESESSDCNDSKEFDSVILEKPLANDISYLLSVSVAESVTAGALSNTLCSEPGSSRFFLGGIVAYNMQTQESLLHVDAEYAEQNNFANPFTTFTMAQNVTKIFNSRIGLSTTGFSLPLYRERGLESGKCEIDVKVPYAYICLYDSKDESHKIYKIINDEYIPGGNQKVQRAQMQSKIALECKYLFHDYCLQQSKLIQSSSSEE